MTTRRIIRSIVYALLALSMLGLPACETTQSSETTALTGQSDPGRTSKPAKAKRIYGGGRARTIYR
jgi:hypothetical protein